MSATLITIPALHKREIAFDPGWLSQWSPEHLSLDVARLGMQCEAMLAATQQGLARKGRAWVPHHGQLTIALTALIHMGLDLTPTANECCLLSFWEKKEKGGYHNVVPYVMRDGYRRFASSLWAILDDDAVVAFEGDLWEYTRTSKGTTWKHRESEANNRIALIQASGALSNAPLLGGGGRITFNDRAEHAHVVTGARLREKLQNNKNTGNTIWTASPIAMLTKAVLIETYKSLPMRGQPAAAMRLAQMAEGHALREMQSHLLSAARSQGMPGEIVEETEALEVGRGVAARDSDELSPFEFVEA